MATQTFIYLVAAILEAVEQPERTSLSLKKL
jgi:hypothetical protein